MRAERIVRNVSISQMRVVEVAQNTASAAGVASGPLHQIHRRRRDAATFGKYERDRLENNKAGVRRATANRLGNTMKLIYAKDRLTNDILGLVPDGYTLAQEAALLSRIESYYGFECEVVTERR